MRRLLYHHIYLLLLPCLLLVGMLLSACTGGGTASATPGSGTANTTTGSTHSSSAASGLAANTPVASVPLGKQPCPTAVSATAYWDPLIPTQADVNQVESVTCAYMLGTSTLQSIIAVRSQGTGAVLDVYVYTNILDPAPKRIFSLLGLYKGKLQISAYSTLLTAEVDQNSRVNNGVGTSGQTVDLYREFAWFDSAHTLVPVSFPGIFPDLTRYQAENDQQQVSQGQQSWKLHADTVAAMMANTLFKWSTNIPTSIVSGGGAHDQNAVVTIKRAADSSTTIRVSLSRLEGRANGIWLVTDVETNGMTLSTPKNRDLLSSPIAISGLDSTFAGHVGSVTVLDHLYNDIGHTNTSGNNNTTFNTTLSYTSTFKVGTQEGVVALYSYNADGSIAGALLLKELLS